MQVISIDPGTHVGVALFDLNMELEIVRLTDCYTIRHKDADDTLHALISSLLSNNPGLVIIEDFILSKFVGQNKEALFQIGAVKYVCKDKDIPLVLRSPALRKPFESKAKVMGGKTPHEVSAIAHALSYLDKYWKKV